jgi:plasmid stabilization system protein ParE
MGEHSSFTVFYTQRADTDAVTIKNYLLYKFTQKEVDHFYKLLENFEALVVVFPELFRASSVNNKNIRKAVLSKQLSVFYIVSKKRISVVAILDNRMNPDKWP